MAKIFINFLVSILFGEHTASIHTHSISDDKILRTKELSVEARDTCGISIHFLISYIYSAMPDVTTTYSISTI